METPKHKLHTNIGSFLTPDQKDHADKIFEFLKNNNLTESQQIQILEVEKAELLEVLDEVYDLVTDFTADSLMIIEAVVEKAIQKHKK